MKSVTSDNFGLIIAYLIPGATVLGGVSLHSQLIASWLGADSSLRPSIGGFLYCTLASIATGLVINALRWSIIDPIHYLTGVPRKSWDYSKLAANIEACQFLVQNQYRYFQFYANEFIAIVIAVQCVWKSEHPLHTWQVALAGVVGVTIWHASRDTLRNYHKRVSRLLDPSDPPCPSTRTSNAHIKGKRKLKTAPTRNWAERNPQTYTYRRKFYSAASTSSFMISRRVVGNGRTTHTLRFSEQFRTLAPMEGRCAKKNRSLVIFGRKCLLA